MSLLKRFFKNDADENADYFIKSKVNELVERSVKEGKRREVIENKVVTTYSNPNTEDGVKYLNSIPVFLDFPKYQGRGIQESAPEIDSTDDVSTLVLRFTDVYEEDYVALISEIEAAGFVHTGNDYIKTEKNIKYTMSVSYSSGKLRIFHMVSAA